MLIGMRLWSHYKWQNIFTAFSWSNVFVLTIVPLRWSENLLCGICDVWCLKETCSLSFRWGKSRWKYDCSAHRLTWVCFQLQPASDVSIITEVLYLSIILWYFPDSLIFFSSIMYLLHYSVNLTANLLVIKQKNTVKYNTFVKIKPDIPYLFGPWPLTVVTRCTKAPFPL